MKKIKNRSVQVTAYADKKQVGSLYDSFQSLIEVKEVIKRKFPNATWISVGDINDETYYKTIDI